jgi:hypothetical protein
MSRPRHWRRNRKILNKSEGRLRSRKRPSYFDGGKPNSVSVIAHAEMIIYLTRMSPNARRILIRRGATIPEDQMGRLPFLCFVLHRMGFFVPRELLRER